MMDGRYWEFRVMVTIFWVVTILGVFLDGC